MDEFDFLVVGSGAAGAAAAYKLCKRGFRVACVERGTWQAPEQYPTNFVDWERRKMRASNPVIGQRLNEWDYPVDDGNSPIAYCNFNGIGGSTILYSGHFPRFREACFKRT